MACRLERPDLFACFRIEAPEMAVAMFMVTFADVDATPSDRGGRENGCRRSVSPDDLSGLYINTVRCARR